MLSNVIYHLDEQNQQVKATLYSKVKEWMGRATKLKSGIQKPVEPTPASGGTSEGSKKYIPYLEEKALKMMTN